jgi:hypothetical protein
MKNIYDVLRQKEQQSDQLLREIEALRLAIKILEEAEAASLPSKPELRPTGLVSGAESALAAGTPPKRFP